MIAKNVLEDYLTKKHNGYLTIISVETNGTGAMVRFRWQKSFFGGEYKEITEKVNLWDVLEFTYNL